MLLVCHFGGEYKKIKLLKKKTWLTWISPEGRTFEKGNLYLLLLKADLRCAILIEQEMCSMWEGNRVHRSSIRVLGQKRTSA